MEDKTKKTTVVEKEPYKIAVIDLGSNSARLVIANVFPGDATHPGHYMIIDELKEQVRLAQDMNKDGFLKSPRIAQAVKTLLMFKKLIDSHKVKKTYAFATNAVRNAKNQKSFIEEISAVCGFKFSVLSEEEEAIHIYQGVINSLDISKAVIVDMSGSSFHLIQYNRRNVINKTNIPFGTMTLNEIFGNDGLDAVTQAKMVETYVKNQLEEVAWLAELEPETQFVGVGGSFRNLARIINLSSRYPVANVHNFVVETETLNKVYDSITKLDAQKRSKIKGLSSQRSDIFLAAIATIKAFLETVNCPKITVSRCGLREGVLINHAAPTTQERPLSEVLWHSVYSNMKHFGINIRHSEHVHGLSITLYKQLRVLHKLPRQYVKILRAAALLHDAGLKVRHNDHNRHSLYFILNCTINGFTHREQILTAFVAHGHCQDEFPIDEWNKYKSILREEDLAAVLKLGVILRITEALDRTQNGCVKNINCDVLGGAVILKTEVEGDCSLEIKEALAAGSDFARAYRKNLEII